MKIVKMAGLVVASLLALTHCAPIQVGADAKPAKKTGQNVEFGVPAFAPVGGTVFSQFDYNAVTRAFVQAPYSRSVGVGGRIILSVGQPLFPAMVAGQQAYCSDNPTFLAYLGSDNRRVCYFDNGNTGRFTTAYVAGTLADTKLDVDVPYSVREEAIGAGFKYELLYQGFDRGVVRVAYREYLADFARPAFQQDLTYTLDPSGTTEASFRNVRFVIISADNNGIKYYVTRGFQ
jgi:hypothetical protein